MGYSVALCQNVALLSNFHCASATVEAVDCLKACLHGFVDLEKKACLLDGMWWAWN